MSDSRPVQRFGTVVIVGGGCYGSYYVRQMQRALAAGAVTVERLVVVDRDPACRVALETRGAAGAPRIEVVTAEWGEYFADYLGRAAADLPAAVNDAIVPSPLMPHLLYEWLAGRMRARWPSRRVESAPLDAEVAVPWQRAGEDGTHYVSFATWMCPINCVEPARCPHTKGTRDWTMPAALSQYVADAQARGRGLAGPYVFHCTHRAYGVGMIDVRDVIAADADLTARAELGSVDAVVGTVSHCHGAVSRLLVGARTTQLI